MLGRGEHTVSSSRASQESRSSCSSFQLACVAGVRKGRGRELGRPTRSLARPNSLFPFQRRPHKLRFSHNRSYVADEVLHTPCPPGITATFSTLGFYPSGVNLCVQNFAANFSLQIVRQTKFYSRAKKENINCVARGSVRAHIQAT